MTKEPNPTSAANGAFPPPPAGLDLDKLIDHLDNLDFEDVIAVINALISTYTPPAEERAEFFTCLYVALADYNFTLSAESDNHLDVQNYYQTLLVILRQDPGLLEDLEEEGSLHLDIDEAHIRVLSSFDYHTPTLHEIINIISAWREIAVLHILHKQPIDQFCQILEETLSQEFGNPVIKRELNALLAEIDRHFMPALPAFEPLIDQPDDEPNHEADDEQQGPDLKFEP